MLRLFTMALVVVATPLSQKITHPPFVEDNAGIEQSFTLHFKNNFPQDLLSTSKKTAEPYSQNWYAEVQENIRKSEYHFKWDEKLKAYSTPNRKNNLRFNYTDHGFSVEPRTTKISIGDPDPMKRPDEIKYRSIPNWKTKFNFDKKQLGKGSWRVTENKAEYITNNITVQYLNNDEGMRQNFIVHSPLSKKDEIEIDFSIKTRLRSVVNNNRLQFLHKKNVVLNYDDLKVWDAKGKSLSAVFKKNKQNNYAIVVNTTGAVYPVTIDPISTTPAAIVESNNTGARMGASVASAGDVNGDGYSDVVVGAYFYNNGQASEGAFFVYHGSATGISTTAAVMIESNLVGPQLGYSVASAGDVNRDGYSDIVVGAPLYTNGESSEGAFFVYHGSATGINTTAAATVESNQAGCKLGLSVACAGDVNGDGYSDIIVGASGYSNGQSDEGAFYVYHGSATGINTTAAVIAESNQASANLGFSVAGAGDVNGDGYSDVIAGARLYDNGETDEGAAFVYHGGPAGINSTPVVMIESNQASAIFGNSVASAGDVNGDGYSDIIVGAPQYSNGQSMEGVAFVYHGSATGVNTTLAAMVESNQVNAFMGTSVASAGDVNGDGYSDIITGASGYDNGQTDEGAAFVYQGSAAGINTTAETIIESNLASASMGTAASAGDVNGDGYSDIITGASGYDNGQTDEGAAFVYHGSASGINTSAALTVESNQVNAYMGESVAPAGDVNGDGYSDIIVGAYQYDNGETDEGVAFLYHGSATGIGVAPTAMLEANQANASFGYSVASAGDVNADGYSDVIIGGSGYDNSQTDEGVAFVYHGSATGINTTVAVILENNQVGAYYGNSVASAGDVNGDGYSDVIVGDFFYSNGQAQEGAAFIYYGSATGIINVAATIMESNQVSAYFGISVAGAGDVNGDGFSDVIVGAEYFANGQVQEGAAFIYHGSATGISNVAAAMVESNQAIANLGLSVAGAGDVNGDGYSDVIVGAYNYDNGQTDEGAAFIYHGSAGGIITTAAAMVESNQADARMGISVSSAGDVNGDGYGDVIVGAHSFDNGQANEGAAFVYLGSATGISIVAAAMAESNQTNAQLGYSVAGAGDVNGDGYSDVIVGANTYASGQLGEGAFFVFHGNSPGNNKRNSLRLYNANLVTPINSSNFIFANFGAGLFAKSFIGRSKGKLVWETRRNYNPWSGTPITNSTLYTSQQVSYTDMGLAGIELKNVIDKLLGSRYTKLRARIKYDPVTSITGQVYSPWRNVSSIIDANSLGVLPVELISFNAAWLQKGRSAQVNFKTDKESGICCFDIEKSTDGFNYTSIGTVAARNIAGIQSYSFIDNNASNKKQYYRLKVKGIAGKVDYSNIQQLQNNGATEIIVFPNPTAGILQFQFNKWYNKMNVQIVNSAGQTVKQFASLPVPGQTLSISVHDLPAGSYWLNLQSGDEKQTLQFVKQ